MPAYTIKYISILLWLYLYNLFITIRKSIGWINWFCKLFTNVLYYYYPVKENANINIWGKSQAFTFITFRIKIKYENWFCEKHGLR